MSKIKLLLRPDEFTSFQPNHLQDFWNRYFTIELFDEKKSYDSRAILVAWCNNSDDPQLKALQQQGLKVAIDNMWEYPTNGTDFYWIECRNWFWYNESLWWRALDQHTITVAHNPTKLAFMPMRFNKPSRRALKKIMEPFLDQFIWSFVDKKLPGDIDPSSTLYQRYVNPDWYSNTYFSIVSETKSTNDMPWPTEKSFKPIAYYHPYMIAGQKGCLQYLRNLGFETFDNMFDESYDLLENYNDRINLIAQNVKEFCPEPYTQLTIEKMKHNHNLFFDQPLVENKIIQEIVHPLLEYAET